MIKVIGSRSVQGWLAADIRQDTCGKQQTIQIKCVEQFILRVKATDVNIPLRMNETLITYIYSHMHHPLFFL